jgi:hypothetical protein
MLNIYSKICNLLHNESIFINPPEKPKTAKRTHFHRTHYLRAYLSGIRYLASGIRLHVLFTISLYGCAMAAFALR